MGTKDIIVAKGISRKLRPAWAARKGASNNFLDGIVTPHRPPLDLESIVGVIKERLGASEVLVFMVDNQTGLLHQLRPTAVESDCQAWADDLRYGDPQAWMKLFNRAKLIVDVRHGPALADVRRQLLKAEISSVLLLPLRLAGELVGGVAILHRQPYGWSKSDLSVANALVWQVAAVFQLCRIEYELRRAQQAREDFLARAAHELRTPLTSIVAYAQYLEHYVTNGPCEKEFELRLIRMIEAQSERLAGVIQDVLDIKTMNGDEFQLKKEPLDLGALLGEATEEIRQVAGDNPVETQLASLPIVVADRRRLRQVIMKLLNNAVAYSPGGGTVLVSAQSKVDNVLVSVQDHGMGIKEHQRRFVFDRFFEGDDHSRLGNGAGLGIGLYTSRAIIEAHGGQMWMESQEGLGSTFWFTLPIG